ncbi:MAG: hypothetical protein P4L76_00395 [Beijerinckiaceae bacterium]|nr:hypothetical protein [Beijerinckiaceae bacterium]
MRNSRHAGKSLISNATWPVLIAALAAASLAAPARADEPKGCESFKWPVQRDAALLQAPGKPILQSGASAAIDGKAFEFKLVAFDAAALPKPPERSPKISPSQAGFLSFAAPAAGSYQITLSAAAWIDIVQNGNYIKPSAFSGATDCPGARKSVRVSLAASPFTLQISSTQGPAIGVVIAPAP